MKNKQKNIIKKVIGYFLIILGIVGIILPVLPGWIFVFIGLQLIGINLIFFDKIKEYAKNKASK